MTISTHEIELRIGKVKELEMIAESMKTELTKELEKMDKEKFNGLGWYEFMAQIDEKIVVDDKMSITRKSYMIHGKCVIDEQIILSVSGNIYYNDERFAPSLEYKKTGRYLSNVPKKYMKQYEELVAEMRKYQIERPSEKYGKRLGMVYY